MRSETRPVRLVLPGRIAAGRVGSTVRLITSRPVVVNGVPVVAAGRLPSMLRALPAVLTPERVACLADQARVRFYAAA